MPKGTEEVEEYFSGESTSCVRTSCLFEIMDKIKEYEETAIKKARTRKTAIRASEFYDKIREGVIDTVANNLADAIWYRIERKAYSYETNYILSRALISSLAEDPSLLERPAELVDILLDAIATVRQPLRIRTVRNWLYDAAKVDETLIEAAREARRLERAIYGA